MFVIRTAQKGRWNRPVPFPRTMGAAASTTGLSESTQKALDGMPDAAKTELAALLAKKQAEKKCDPAQDAAATKLQAIQRGNQSRVAGKLPPIGGKLPPVGGAKPAGDDAAARAAFDQIDKDKSGSLEKQEIKDALLATTSSASIELIESYSNWIDQELSKHDKNFDTKFSFAEFEPFFKVRASPQPGQEAARRWLMVSGSSRDVAVVRTHEVDGILQQKLIAWLAGTRRMLDLYTPGACY
jgi:hypothetical protein